jgi:hypothetical protein
MASVGCVLVAQRSGNLGCVLLRGERATYHKSPEPARCSLRACRATFGEPLAHLLRGKRTTYHTSPELARCRLRACRATFGGSRVHPLRGKRATYQDDRHRSAQPNPFSAQNSRMSDGIGAVKT